MSAAAAVTVDVPVPVYPRKLEEILALEPFLGEFSTQITDDFLTKTERTLNGRERSDRALLLRHILGGFFLGEPYALEQQLNMMGKFVRFGEVIQQDHSAELREVLSAYEQQCQQAITAVERPIVIPSDSRPAIRKDDVDMVFDHLGAVPDEQRPIAERAQKQLETWIGKLEWKLTRGLNELKHLSGDFLFRPEAQLEMYTPPGVASLIASPGFYPTDLAEEPRGEKPNAGPLASLYRSAFLGIYARDGFFDGNLFPRLREELISYRVSRFDATILKMRTAIASSTSASFLAGRLMSDIGATGITYAEAPVVVDGIERKGVSLVHGRFQGKAAAAVIFNERTLRTHGFDGGSIDTLVASGRLTFARHLPLQPAEERMTIDDSSIVSYYLGPVRLFVDGRSDDKIDFSRFRGPGARLAEHWYRLAQTQLQFPKHDVARIIERHGLSILLAADARDVGGGSPLPFGGPHVEEQVGAAVWRIRGQEQENPFVSYANFFPSAEASGRSISLMEHYAAQGLADRDAFQPGDIAGRPALIARQLGAETLYELLTFLHGRQNTGQRPQHEEQLRTAEYALLAQFAWKVGAFLAHSPSEGSITGESLRTVDAYLQKFEERFLRWVSREGFELSEKERGVLLAAQRELAGIYTVGSVVMKTDRTPRNEVVDAYGKLHSIDFKEQCIYVPLGAAVADAFGFPPHITHEPVVPFGRLRPFLSPLLDESAILPYEDKTNISLKDFCLLACFAGYQPHAAQEHQTSLHSFEEHYWSAAPQRAFNLAAIVSNVYSHHGQFTYVARFIEQACMRDGIGAMGISNRRLFGGQNDTLSAALGIHQRLGDQHTAKYEKIPEAVMLKM